MVKKNTLKEKIDMKKEAEKIANEKLASQGLTHTEEPNEDNSAETISKVDSFLKSLEEDIAETDIPLDWQPTMNILTRMYEAGEDQYNNVKFYKSKGISVNLNKKQYNDSYKELQRIIFNLSSDAFKYDMKEDKEKIVITITLK